MLRSDSATVVAGNNKSPLKGHKPPVKKRGEDKALVDVVDKALATLEELCVPMS